MEKTTDFRAAAYEQIKKLGGNSTESIKTIDTAIGEMDIKVMAILDFNDIKKVGGAVHGRPYVYRAIVEGMPLPMQVGQKISDKEYETAAAAFEATKAIVEKYAEGVKDIENML